MAVQPSTLKHTTLSLTTLSLTTLSLTTPNTVVTQVDWILHPLKSELNFPIGTTQGTPDLNPERWDCPIWLLEAHARASASRGRGRDRVCVTYGYDLVASRLARD
jgi:hypothetical protein